MSKKGQKRGRKALPPSEKKPPQPTVKVNETLLPFVKLLKRECKAKRLDEGKLAALTQLLLDGHNPIIEKQHPGNADDITEEKQET
ncbi:hypothetical protein JCM14076_18640 [Methylosoma difficile]